MVACVVPKRLHCKTKCALLHRIKCNPCRFESFQGNVICIDYLLKQSIVEIHILH